MWQFAILEIYAVGNGNGEFVETPFPDEGTPADWVQNGLVGYCDGRLEDLLALTPWHVLVRYKLAYWVERVYLWVTWRLSFGRCPDCKKPETIFGFSVGNHKECNPFYPYEVLDK